MSGHRRGPSSREALMPDVATTEHGLSSDRQRLNTAFDIAGLVDLDLRDDVARTELLIRL